MAESKHCDQLLQWVATRLRLVAWGRRWRSVFFILCTVYSIPLLISRFTGYWAGQFLIVHIPILAVVALGISAIWHRRPTLSDAARSVDGYGGTRDLFLTWTMLQQSAGEFQPWVRQAAETTAARYLPRQIIQFPWQKPCLQLGAASLLLGAGLIGLPQLDPFGKIAQAREAEAGVAELAEARRATQQRLAELTKSVESPEQSSEVEKALEKLKVTFGKLDKNQAAQNNGLLTSEQKELGKLWRQMSAEKMAEMLKKAADQQSFGEGGQETLQKWTDELRSGHAESLKKEMQQIGEALQRLAKSSDPAERAQQRQELKKKLQKLKEFADEKVDHKGLKAALDRALAQMEASKRDSEADEGLEAAQESMKLAEEELEQMELSAQEMKDLDEALKLVQAAKKLNEAGMLETDQDDGFTSLEEYRELYAELMQGKDQMEGDGTGGEGQGNGSPAEEDDSGKSEFKPQQSKSAVKAGQILMSINTKGVAPNDAEKEDPKVKYRNLVRTVKEGAEEAIMQEQIPPGYHDGIKSYFNSLEDMPRKKAK